MAANYGLLNNIATGLREGLVTYQTLSNMKNQQRQNDLLMQINMKEKGLIETPEGLAIDPAFKQMQVQEQIAKGAQEGKILEADEAGNIVFKGYSPEYISGQSQIYGAKRPLEFEMNKFNAQLAEKGLISELDPATGERVIKQDPEFDKRKRMEKSLDIISKGAQEGKLLDVDENGNVVFKGYAPGYLEGQKSLKAKPKGPGPSLSKEEMELRKQSVKKYSDILNIKDSIDSVLEILKDPSQPYEQKLATARSSLKLINTAAVSSPDAVGTDEAKRLAAFLEPSLKNMLPGQAGAVWKPKVDEFTIQLDNISKGLLFRAEKAKERSGLSKGLIKDSQIESKVKVQDKSGKTFMLPSSQLQDALKQGYTEVK